MRSTLNPLSALAFIAIGLFLAALSAPTSTALPASYKPEVIEVLDTKAFGNPPEITLGIVYGRNQSGPLKLYGDFAFSTWLYRERMQNDFKDVEIRTVGMDKFDKPTLLKYIEEKSVPREYIPRLYSEALPYLLNEFPLDVLASKLPKRLLETLKPEDRKKIPTEVLAKFEKLYD